MKTRLIMTMVLLLAACTRESPQRNYTGRAGTCRLALNVDAGRLVPRTRSSLDVPDDAIWNLSVFFYADGRLCPELTINENLSGENSYSSKLELSGGSNYDVLAIANCPSVEAPETLGEALSSLACFADGIMEWRDNGLPMAGRTSIFASGGDRSVTLGLTRLVARLNLVIDTSPLRHGSIEFTSLKIRQMNRVCPFFLPGAANADGGVCDGDLADEDDLDALNSGGKTYTTSFYIMENLQGDLMPWNDDPDLKVPDEVTAAGGDPLLCTYLEILGKYRDKSGKLTGEPLTARLFLGSDATSNFDVARNFVYDVTLGITDSGCLRSDWKIDGHLSDLRELSFNRSSGTIAPGETDDFTLGTNLSYAAGDYSYSVLGDVGCFSVQSYGAATRFRVSSNDSSPEGAALTLRAQSWDGALVTECRVTVQRPQVPGCNVGWSDGGGVFYVAQSRRLFITDSDTGNYPSSRVSVQSATGCADVWNYRQEWHVDGVRAGEDVLQVRLDGELALEVPVTIVAPQLRFPSDELFLPLDGATRDCTPAYYAADDSLLEWEDFDADLYDDLLDVYVERSLTPAMKGRWWGSGPTGGNPAVTCIRTSGEYSRYAFRLDGLSSGGHDIADNYDFGSGPVFLETMTAWPANRDAGVVSASARLYTAEPFGASRHLGERESRALALWPGQTEHDEQFIFSFSGAVLPGNDSNYASAVYPFSEENKFSFRFPDSNTVEMTVLYGDNNTSAMPEKYFSMAPVMRNRNSGEVYRSASRYYVDFTVHLAVAGVAENNGAGGCDVRLEWSCPRSDEGLLAWLEDNVTACTASGWESSSGMYSRLYAEYGYSPSELRSLGAPQFCFRDPLSGARLSGGRFVPDESYCAGYGLVLWKLSELCPESNGWLEK